MNLSAVMIGRDIGYPFHYSHGRRKEYETAINLVKY
jgi:hypothetical protein